MLKLPFCNRPEGDELYEDGPWWQVNDGQPDAEMGHQPDDYDMRKIIPNEQGPSYGTMSDWISPDNIKYPIWFITTWISFKTI